MDLHIVTLEITQLVIAFDHYDHLVTGQIEEQTKIRAKHQDHLAIFGVFDKKNLAKIKAAIQVKLAELKTKEIHELIEQLEKDAKKIKKLYKAER